MVNLDSHLNSFEIQERIERNEDALDNLEKDLGLDYWNKARLKLYHEQRIVRWRRRLKEINDIPEIENIRRSIKKLRRLR